MKRDAGEVVGFTERDVTTVTGMNQQDTKLERITARREMYLGHNIVAATTVVGSNGQKTVRRGRGCEDVIPYG